MSWGERIDRLVGVFSPEKAFRRRYARERFNDLAERSSLYAAAKTTRLTGDWSPAAGGVNPVIKASSPAVRARVRQLVRDFPYFWRAVKVLGAYRIGDGIKYQCRITDGSGKLNKKLMTQMEDTFQWWADEADIAGKLHYYEMMQLADRQDTECGEFLIVKVFSTNPNRYLPYSLQIVEPEWLTETGAIPATPLNAVDQGIEYVKLTGEVVAAHIADPDEFGKTRRIDVKDIIHGFECLRPGQRRGISPFSSGVLLANDLGSLMEAEIDAAKMAAKYVAFIKTPNPAERQLPGMTTDPVTGQQIEEMEGAILEYLRPGEDVQLASPDRPGSNFGPYVRLILTMLSVATGCPYEMLSGDYSGVNYSTSRTSRNDFLHILKQEQTRKVRQFCQPTLKGFVEAAFLANKVPMPGYGNDPRFYLRAAWQPPGMESIDPLRESKARAEEIKAGLRSPQEIAAARGVDLEDIYREIAEAKAMAEEYGLTFGEQDTTLKNNPAAVAGEETGDGE